MLIKTCIIKHEPMQTRHNIEINLVLIILKAPYYKI